MERRNALKLKRKRSARVMGMITWSPMGGRPAKIPRAKANAI